jgi:hypothetical protein
MAQFRTQWSRDDLICHCVAELPTLPMQFLPRRRRSTHLPLLIHPCQPIVAKQQINGADWSKRCPLIVVEAAAI